jgi:uncharacterized membrane protein
MDINRLTSYIVATSQRGEIMKGKFFWSIPSCVVILGLSACSGSGGGFTSLTPSDGMVALPIARINDGSAHYFRVKADNGITVSFFTLKSKDGTIRAAVDACDVCFKAGKGYFQQGDFMVCENCGQRFASARINEVKGGCNPAPLSRSVENGRLFISMKEINSNSWYSQFKPQT